MGTCQDRLRGAQQGHCQGVNLPRHQGNQTIIHEAVTLQPGQAGKTGTDQAQPVVAPAGARARMTGMAGAFVLDLQFQRLERAQQIAYLVDRGFVNHL